MSDDRIEIKEVEHIDDTQPINVDRIADRKERWRSVLGFVCLIMAVGLTIATALVISSPTRLDVETETPSVEPTFVSMAAIPTNEPSSETLSENLLPTLSPIEAQALLSTPISVSSPNSIQIVRNNYDPFTIIPDRPRSEAIEYEVVSGDTINSIAEQFGLQPETIAWSNPRSIIQILRPGDRVTILPVDGVYHVAIGSSTIAEIAAQYGVDPYTILNSEFNTINGFTPDTVPPSGTPLVIAGGTAEQISWNPPVVRVGGGSSGNSSVSGGSQISFADGDPGSCGLVDNPGGGAAWARPINNYTWIRGFASWHPAVDLAAPEGTSVYAANGGRVIFAGWSNWGYGNTVVLAHGPFTTIYAHLGSINVGCGQDVTSGQQIAGSGNSGNSSGPHLHFEIRYQDAPQDPTFTIGF